MTHASGAYLRIDQPAEHVLVQAHHDGSSIIAVFGPFPSLEAAETARAHLLEVGIGDGAMTPMPIREVELNERPCGVTLVALCRWSWGAPTCHVSGKADSHRCSRKQGVPHPGNEHLCDCGSAEVVDDPDDIGRPQ